MVICNLHLKPSPTIEYYRIISEVARSRCLLAWFHCLCVSAEPPPHNTPTHMARAGWRPSDIWDGLCVCQNNAETCCCSQMKQQQWLLLRRGKSLTRPCSLLLFNQLYQTQSKSGQRFRSLDPDGDLLTIKMQLEICSGFWLPIVSRV